MDEDFYWREYQERFEWRKEIQVSNLRELSEIAQSGGAEALKVFPGLKVSRANFETEEALRWSILLLWLQATESYIFGLYAACILTGGAVAERCLKLEYEVVKGSLPKGNWTLGRCIHQLEWAETRITSEILELAKQIVGPRNSHAHALLEHTDPRLALLGGRRRVHFLDPAHYIIEPYKEEAKDVIVATYQLLKALYGSA